MFESLNLADCPQFPIDEASAAIPAIGWIAGSNPAVPAAIADLQKVSVSIDQLPASVPDLNLAGLEGDTAGSTLQNIRARMGEMPGIIAIVDDGITNDSFSRLIELGADDVVCNPTPQEIVRALQRLRRVVDRRKRDQAALLAAHEERDYLQAGIDSLPAPIFFKNCEGIYIGFNSAFQRYLGLPPTRIRHATVYDVAPAALADVYREADEALMRIGEPQVYDTQVRYADGELRDIEFHKAVLRRGDGQVMGLAGIMLDITDRKRLETELDRQAAKLDAAIQNMSQGLLILDPDERVVLCNERYRLMRRLSYDELTPGRPLRDVLTRSRELGGFAGDVEEYLVQRQDAVNAHGSFRKDERLPDGRIMAVTVDVMPNGGRVATFEDVTDRREAEARIEQLAHFDPLTGVANRSQFLNGINQARERLQATGEPFSVLMLDLDRFKIVNDSLGHDSGDVLLTETARRLQSSLRSTDLVARLGGDEFAIIQTVPRAFAAEDDVAQLMRESAVVLANRLIALVSEPYEISGQYAFVGASIGIVMAPTDGSEPSELMKKADLALYKTKSEGRNGFSFFDQEFATAADERQQMESDLRAGLSSNQFELYYQPIIDIATRQTRCMEALVRWNHPAQGLISPDRFIALAEETGLVHSLGEWIIQTACTQAAQWPSHVSVAINISPVQFRKTDLLDVIMCALVDSGLPPERLVVEITEQVLLENQPDYLSILHQLKNLNIAISLDDFGTGYSSLRYLQTFPFDKLKIDQSFIRDIMKRSDSAAIASAIINLGRALDIETIAEGVETEDQLELLRAAGLTQAQGFLFSRPLPAYSFPIDTGRTRTAVVGNAA